MIINQLTYKLFVLKYVKHERLGATDFVFHDESITSSYFALVVAKSEHEAIEIFNKQLNSQNIFWGGGVYQSYCDESSAGYILAIELGSCPIEVQIYFQNNQNYREAYQRLAETAEKTCNIQTTQLEKNIQLTQIENTEESHQKTRLRTEIGSIEFFQKLALELGYTSDDQVGDTEYLLKAIAEGKIAVGNRQQKTVKLTSHKLEEFIIKNTQTLKRLQDLAYKLEFIYEGKGSVTRLLHSIKYGNVTLTKIN